MTYNEANDYRWIISRCVAPEQQLISCEQRGAGRHASLRVQVLGLRMPSPTLCDLTPSFRNPAYTLLVVVAIGRG